MAKVNKDPKHEQNMLKLWMPTVWTASVGAIMLAIGIVLDDILYDAATYFYVVSPVLLMSAIPVAVTCIARTIEYDRLRSEILRGSARTIGNMRIDKLINKFYATTARQRVCALALSTLEFGLSEKDSLAQVQRIHHNRRKRLTPPKLLSKDWWLAHFTPVDLN